MKLIAIEKHFLTTDVQNAWNGMKRDAGRVGERNLDHISLLSIFEMAASLSAPILLHPRAAPQPVRDAYYSGISPEIDAAVAAYGLGWHYDAGIQFVRMILARHFDRLPNLQLILGHWGELVLFYAERLSAFDRFAKRKKPVASYFKENLHVTASGMFFSHYLERAAKIVGKNRILSSTDYPYQYRPGRDAQNFLQTCGLSGQEQEAFASGNWLRLVSGVAADPEDMLVDRMPTPSTGRRENRVRLALAAKLAYDLTCREKRQPIRLSKTRQPR